MEEIRIEIGENDDEKYTQRLSDEMMVLRENSDLSESNLVWLNHHRRSDSPLSTCNNSDDEMGDLYHKIENQIGENVEKKYANELDITATFLQGQKIAYLHANKVTEHRLRCLTMTTLFFSSSVCIIIPFFKMAEWTTIYVVIMNAIITILVMVMNHFKLESTAENYLHTAMQFDKMRIALEYDPKKRNYYSNHRENKKIIRDKLDELENMLLQLKESSFFIVPDEIKHIYRLIMHLNIFSVIHKINMIKYQLVEQWMNNKKETMYIIQNFPSSKDNSREKKRLVYLAQLKDSIKSKLNDCNTAYDYLDVLINCEINAICSVQWNMLRVEPVNYYQKNTSNIIVDDYLQSTVPGFKL